MVTEAVELNPQQEASFKGLLKQVTGIDTSRFPINPVLQRFNQGADISDVFAGNKARKSIAGIFLETLTAQELAYLTDKTSDKTDPSLIASGLLYDAQNRRTMTTETLSKLASLSDQTGLTNLYLSKCGDLARAFFDSDSHGNASVQRAVADELQTIAVLQLALDGDTEIIQAFQKSEFRVDNYLYKSKIASIPKQHKDKIAAKSADFLEAHLWMVNAFMAIHRLNPALASSIFGRFERGNQPESSFENEFKTIAITSIPYHQQGFFRRIGKGYYDFQAIDRWEPLMDGCRDLFSVQGPVLSAP